MHGVQGSHACTSEETGSDVEKGQGRLPKHATVQPELEWGSVDAEMKWLLQLHSEKLFTKCGELATVDKNLLPLGGY